MTATGRFLFHDLMTTDLPKSAGFLAGLLGLEIAAVEGKIAYYVLLRPGTNQAIVGLVPVMATEETRSHWVGYLSVPDVVAAIAQTRAAGGAVHAQPGGLASDDDSDDAPDMPTTGSGPPLAIVTDPAGAVVGLVPPPAGAPDDASESEDVAPLGEIAWVELLTVAREAAGAFFTTLVGWELGAAHTRFGEGEAHALFRGGRLFGLVRDLPAGSPIAPHWMYYFRVPDLDAALATTRRLGGFYYEDPGVVDGGRRAIVLDPTGAPVGLWQLG
jgi:predicted enzyme related to lactoylglutathione lyase